MTLIPELPTPKKLLREARAEPHSRPYDLLAFGQVIDTLFRKGFSYAKIAKWFSVRLETPVERGQVFYVYKKWLLNQAVAQSRKYLVEDEPRVLEDSLTGELAVDSDLDKFLQESDKRRLNADADNEDAKRKGKGHKKV